MQARFQTKTQFAAEAIRSAVRSGQFAPGQRIDAEAQAAQLGMSATPVREALRLLEAEGLVVNDPHRGSRVPEFSASNASELYALRATLEAFATRLSVPHLSDDDKVALREIESQRQEAVAAGDFVRQSELNWRWHMMLYQHAMAAPYLMDFISRLWNAFPWATAWNASGQVEQSEVEHGAITEAVTQGDGERAARLIEAHISRGRDAVLQLLTQAEVRRGREHAQ